jgi:hypothetical protein
MIYGKTNPTGIDVPIQKVQKLLHDRLNTKWSVEISAYGRAYILKKGGLTIPEVFVDGGDYDDVLSLDDNRFFFIQSDSAIRYSNTLYETDVDIYFILNLKEIKPSINHRADEEVHNDIDYLLNQTEFTINSIETGITNVLSDFSIKDSDNFNLSDFEPYHVFKVMCTVQYDLQTTKCNV